MASEKRKASHLFEDIRVDRNADFRGPASFKGQASFDNPPELPVSVVGAGEVAPEDGVTATGVNRVVRHVRLELAAVEVAVLDADNFGSAKLADLPLTNIALLAVAADLSLTKDGTGYVAATDLSVALGTTAATATDLTTTPTESDLIDAAALTEDELTVALEAHSNGNASPAVLLLGPGEELYLNLSGTTETSEDAAVTASGTVDLYFVDLGA
ncbi:hypothetical protein ELZ19_06720 [Brucella abortus]|uniref:hypothetical protein n=1 Tax=Brucella abortus TaxID=235 RepID=UPI0004E973F3|nr:hypothetical protein [Brucella abortus]KFH18428.1 hypothetical protein IB60_17110 [Brucella abortus LMN1]RUQ67342.1 hypothetical protein ELZ23_15555 [Brucella abortus]RUQ78154.1 hypothetical protein ELZ22_17320 [Brucella abortus]RUQ88271.1 hypothetical protein ELZ18_15525 [Brucella abortus]RUQ90300.1 hypothetical protein ELZ20_15520 [Brucella abortus]